MQKGMEETVPNDWQTSAVTIPIHRGRDANECQNYRGITLLCIGVKMYKGILENEDR